MWECGNWLPAFFVSYFRLKKAGAAGNKFWPAHLAPKALRHRGKGEGEKRRQWKLNSTLTEEKEPLVASTVKLLHHKEQEKTLNGDQEGCRVGLEPAPDESW